MHGPAPRRGFGGLSSDFFSAFFSLTCSAVRGRIRSVNGIKKITASMKMVAAARLGKQERTTIAARPFSATLQKAFKASVSVVAWGGGAKGRGLRGGQEVAPGPLFLTHVATPSQDDVSLEGKKQVVALVTSDKGLCGSLNSTLVRPLQLELRSNAANISVACIGVKGRNGLATSFRDNIWFHVAEFGKNPVTFMEVSVVADQIVNSPDRRDHDLLRLQFNYYLNMVQSRPTDTKFLSKNAFVNEQKDLSAVYEFEGGLKDEEAMADLYDFLIAGSLYGAIMENQAAELGMRMSSMENATKNCGEVRSVGGLGWFFSSSSPDSHPIRCCPV